MATTYDSVGAKREINFFESCMTKRTRITEILETQILKALRALNIDVGKFQGYEAR